MTMFCAPCFKKNKQVHKEKYQLQVYPLLMRISLSMENPLKTLKDNFNKSKNRTKAWKGWFLQFKISFNYNLVKKSLISLKTYFYR